MSRHYNPVNGQSWDAESLELLSKTVRRRRKPPRFKSWYCENIVVSARSQGRAAELVGRTIHYFRQDFKLHHGYSYASCPQEEGVWVVPTDKWPSGPQSLVPQQEVGDILRQTMEDFQTMPETRLRSMIGHQQVRDHVCANGRTVTVQVDVQNYEWEPSVICVTSMICGGHPIGCMEILEREIVPDAELRWQECGF